MPKGRKQGYRPAYSPAFAARLDEVKEFIKLYWTSEHFSPSVNDLSEHFDVSNAVTQNWLKHLERDGWIEKRRPGIARNIVPVEIFAGRQVFPTVFRTDDPRADYTVIIRDGQGNERVEQFQEDDTCPYCHGSNLDMDGGTGGSCTHCINGKIKR